MTAVPRKLPGRLARLLTPETGPLSVAVVCMLVLAVTTALAAALVGPAVQGLILGTPSTGLAARFLPRELLGSPLGLPLALVAIAAVKGLAYFGQFDLMARIGQRTASRLRRAMLGALLRASPEELGRQQTGELLTRFSRDATAVEMAVTYAIAGYVRDTASAALLFAVCLTVDWRLSLIACAALPLTLVPLARLLKQLRRRLKEASRSQGVLGHLVAEGLQGLPSIQVDGLQEREAARFHVENQVALQNQLASANVRSLLSPLMEVAAAAGLCIVLVVAAESVARGTLSGEKLLSFLAAALLLAQPLKALGKVGHFLVAGQVALGRIDQLLAELGTGAVTGREAAPLARELRLTDVRFRYRESAPPALDGLSLTVRHGEHVAVVGASGAGKTTLFQLLLGLRVPEAGEILYDADRLDALAPASVFRHLAWMGQDPFVFDGTFADNIALGEAQPDPARLRAAAERAQATAFIERAGGFEAQVGERGRRLSGGERQRLCIARTLYQDVPLLLLDEPTSHLDPENEAALQLALRELLPGRTALIIAHRLTTIRACDRAVVLDHGRLVEDGAPEVLLRSGGAFAALFGSRSGSHSGSHSGSDRLAG